jgi:hypothetical protein
VDGDGEGDLLHVRRHARQVHHDHFVVALAGAGAIVAGVLHRAAGGFQLVVENEIGLRADLAIGAQQER